MSIVWQDDVTPLDAAHMNLLEQTARKGAVNGYASLAADGKVPAAQLPPYPASYFVTPAPGYARGNDVVFQFMRSGAAGAQALGIGQPGDTTEHLRIGSDGQLVWGPGNAAGDTNLYRAAARNLKSDGTLWAVDSLVAETGRLYFGAALDTQLNRFSAGQLGTPADVVLGTGGGHGVLYANYGSAGTAQVWIGQYGGSLPYAAITFGSDSYLYRAGANILKTDGYLYTGQAVYAMQGAATQVGLVAYQGAYAGIELGGDALLFRMQANMLATGGDDGFLAQSYLYIGQTDSYFYRAGVTWIDANATLTSQRHLIANRGSSAQVMVGNNGSGFIAGLAFGSTQDVQLYRDAGQSPWGPGIKATPHLYSANDLIARVGSPNMVQIGYVGGGAPGVSFGNVGDTNLFRAAAQTLSLYGSSWGTFQAAAFAVQSDRTTKRDIERAEPLYDRLLGAGVYHFRRDGSETRRLGLMADELPEDVGGSKFVDLYALCAVLVQTVQHLNGRLAALEAA